ncbi:hypothetical protein GLW05_10620 [Pontibacillus yanchengensis]|uniref:Uncharacterized protein n=1 Tax=Pontibacillus yanchengensis TaxID=462910 RepID=A0A6I5A3W5_9BACI|nr:hypothetical protein [Pontibacillus yanchengensis]MYL34049.1 hypothetical protein [Pontibacillus yanchengensis]
MVYGSVILDNDGSNRKELDPEEEIIPIIKGDLYSIEELTNLFKFSSEVLSKEKIMEDTQGQYIGTKNDQLWFIIRDSIWEESYQKEYFSIPLKN